MKLSGTSSGRFTRRGFLQAASATAATALLGDTLAACGSGPSGSSSGSVNVAYWDWLVSQAPWIDNEIKLFQQAHPTIKVKKTTNATSTYDNLFTLAVKSNNVPDVFMITTTATPLNDQVAKGWLLPLDKWATTAWKSRFPADAFAEGVNVFNGHIYSLPLSGHSPWLQLYIHNGVFKDAGLTNADGSVKVPKTWDDVTHAAEVITQKGNGNTYGLGFGNGAFNLIPWWLELFVRGAGSPGGAYSMDSRTGKYTMGSDRNYLDFINLMMEWKQKGYFYPNSASATDEIARANFERGKFGMTVGGVWNQAEWTQHKFTDYSLTTLLSPTATPQGYFYYTPGGTMWAMSSKTKHPDEAFAWFDWLYSADAGKRWTQVYNEDLSVYPADNDPTQIKFTPFAQFVSLSSFEIEGPSVGLRNPATSQVVVNPVSPNIGDIMTGIYTGQIKASDYSNKLMDLQTRLQKAQDDGVQQAIQRGIKVSPSDWAFSDWDPTRPYVTQAKSS